MAEKFTDSATLEVLGARSVLDRLRPDSEVANLLVGQLERWVAGHENSWSEELARRKAAESWAEADPERTRAARTALSEMPSVHGVISQLRADVPLEEPELFAAKRFLWAAHEVFRQAEDLLADWGAAADTTGRLAKLLRAIHPEKTPSRKFRLSPGLQPGLREARDVARAARLRLKEIQTEAQTAVIADVGGRFDIRGWFVPEDDSFAGHGKLVAVDGRWTLGSPEVTAALSELDQANGEVERLESELCARLSDTLRGEVDFLEDVADRVATFDLRLATGRLREQLDGCWPETGDAFALTGGRDPRLVARLSADVQPIDVQVRRGATVVTGPNMGGKSALLRLVGLVQWLAQHALPVPAERAVLPLFDHLVYIGSEEASGVDAEEGLSSFGREVRRVVTWREGRSGTTLWLLDEFGRGTHPDDGAALAADLVTDLANAGDTVVASTHFPTVASLANSTHLRIRGLVGASMLQTTLQSAADAIELRDALQHAMDYRPAEVDDLDVPRDARLVARSLGLSFDENDDE